MSAATNRVITGITADDTGAIGSIAWSPDGQRLAYYWYSWQGAGSRNQLRIVERDGTSMRVHRIDGSFDVIAWSADATNVLALLKEV